MFHSRFLSLLTVATSLSLIPPALHAAGSASQKTINAQGQVGLTNYNSFAFGSAIYTQSWGATNAQAGNIGYTPANLFWSSGTFFTNPGYTAAAQYAAASYANLGVVPVGTAQRWEDTFEASQPASQFPNEPSWIAGDRANGGSPLTNLPEYQAWVAWVKARPSLQAIASDGGPMGQDFRPWGGTWGQISPEMPLAPADCPTGMSACTYGDWWANRWAQTSQLSGAYGIALSDFGNSLPSQPSWLQDFNPAIVAAFAKQAGVTIPAGTVAQQSAYIVANYYPQWNDFIANGYAAFYNALATRITAATGQQALVVAGGFDWPGSCRNWGVDTRMMAAQNGLANHLLVVWDSISIEADRNGDDIVEGIAGSVINAAREPNIRNGNYLSANDSNFWAAVAQFNPTLDAADQQEWGLKQLKRQWLEFAWAHIADRNGNVRRALAFAWRDHWDAGTVDAATTNLIQTITPTRPFGFALYYSTAVERAIEPSVPSKNDAYLNAAQLLAFRQAIPVNYYVSDAALPKINASSAPSAWIVLGAGNYLPPAELASLQKIAPVFTSVAQAQAFTGAPLSFTGGLTGTGFRDQNGRLIITVTNPSTAANAGTINGSIVLRGLYVNGEHHLTNLYTGAVTAFNVTNYTATIPISITRWDTQAFAVTM